LAHAGQQVQEAPDWLGRRAADAGGASTQTSRRSALWHWRTTLPRGLAPVPIEAARQRLPSADQRRLPRVCPVAQWK